MMIDYPAEQLLPKTIPQQSRSAILVVSLLETCEKMLKNGWHPSLSMTPIIQKAGVCNGSLYMYFNSKEGLIIATYEYMLKKQLLDPSMTSSMRKHSLIRTHALLRSIDEKFYLLFMQLRQFSEEYRAFYVDKERSIASYKFAAMLGFWGDGDQINTTANTCKANTGELEKSILNKYSAGNTNSHFYQSASHA